jgi:hypothetical protein
MNCRKRTNRYAPPTVRQEEMRLETAFLTGSMDAGTEDFIEENSYMEWN